MRLNSFDYNETLNMTQFNIRLRRRDIPDEDILDDLKRVAQLRGENSLTRLEYEKYGTFGPTTIIRRFGSWNSAIVKAGLERASRQDISNEELFENLAAVWTRLGRQPYGRHMSDRSTGSMFSTGTYEKRFGSWNNALTAFASYIANDEQSFNISGASSLQSVERTASVSRRTRREINWRLRAKILIRDACICQMCGVSPAKDPETVLHVDHILPWSKGGETVDENLQTLCAVCNIGKSDTVIE